MRTECPTKLLSDLPALEDAFGGHARVADAIATLIKQEEGGKSIALIGSWGSGKSTVVNFLKNEVNESKDTAVFVFDAWSHEGDPLRRSFLEKLIDTLSDIGWIRRDKWQKTKEILKKRLKITTTRKTPRLTLGGIFLAIATLLVPIGLVLVRDQHPPGVVPGWLGYLLVSSPLFVALIILLINLILSVCKIAGATLNWIGSKLPGSKRTQPFIDFLKNSEWSKNWENVLSLLISRSEIDERNESIETPDPTSIEFQEHFQGILEEALKNFKKRYLLIVIDNLDRTDAATAMSIWSTMRTFFEYSESNSRPEWLSRLWLVVPFAPQAPHLLWTRKGIEKNEKNGHETLKKTVKNKSLADEFIDKTFQIVFHVPLPIMSDWKEFFKEQLVQALPNHEEDSYSIYRIFEKKRIHHNRPPTPREIKLFINKLGAYHRIWQDEIPLSIQAWYVIDVSERLKTQSPETVLLNKELLSEDIKGLIKEPEWQKYLASLYFNVALEKAMQVLLGDEIKDYLSSGNDEKLKRLKEQVEPHSFLTVLEHVIADNHWDWAYEEPSALARSALALKGLKQADLPEWQRIRGYLLEGAIEADWSDLSEETSQGLVAILEECPSGRYEAAVQAILEHISEPVAQPEDEETTEAPDSMIIEQWAKGLLILLGAIQQSDHGDFAREHFQMPGNEEFYTRVMGSIAGMGAKKDLLEYFSPSVEASLITTYLAELCDQNKFDEFYAYALSLMLKIEVDWDWRELIQALQNRLSASNVLEPSQLKGLLRALLFLENEGVSEARTALQRFTKNSDMFHHLNYVYDSDDHEAVSLCLLPILEFEPAANIQNQQGQAPQGLQKYNQLIGNPQGQVVTVLADEVREFQKADELLERVAEASNIQKIVSDVIESLIQQEDVYQHISSSSVVKHYDFLQEMLSPESLQSLIKQLVKENDLLHGISEEWEFSTDLARLYLQVLEASREREDRDRFIEFLISELRKLPKETWLEELNEEGHLIALVIGLIKEGVSMELSESFHDALLEHAREILQGETAPSGFEGEWPLLLEGLSKDQKQTFLRNLRDELISQADITQTPILKLYGKALLQTDVLKEEADQVIRRWFAQMLNSQDDGELFWIAEVLDKQPEVFTQSEAETQKTFRRRVENAWDGTEDEQLKQKLEAIANLVGLELEQKSSDFEEEAADFEDSEYEGDE